MGTYFELQLKQPTERNIKIANKLLESKGYIGQTANGVYYGAFVTREQLKEDARFMNEDPEGLKQCPHIERPITAKFLEGFVKWNTPGFCQYKLSYMGEDEERITTINNIRILSDFAEGYPELIDTKKSDNYDKETVSEYIGYNTPESQLELF